MCICCTKRHHTRKIHAARKYALCSTCGYGTGIRTALRIRKNIAFWRAVVGFICMYRAEIQQKEQEIPLEERKANRQQNTLCDI